MNLPIVHVMVDLETLGNEPHRGPLIAIGAVAFIMDREILRPIDEDFEVANNDQRLYYPIGLDKQNEHYRFIIDDDTLQWWLQDDARRAQLGEFINSKYCVTLREAFEKFEWWVQTVCNDQKRLMLWSHGATYDCVHLATKWPIVLKQSFNRICPFRQMRDTRTLFAAYEEKFGKGPYTFDRKRPHHPLEDAWVQAVDVQKAWKGLTRG